MLAYVAFLVAYVKYLLAYTMFLVAYTMYLVAYTIFFTEYTGFYPINRVFLVAYHGLSRRNRPAMAREGVFWDELYQKFNLEV